MAIFVVTGFMRSGTSMMMRALEAGGLDACYDASRDEMKARFADEKYDPNIGGLYELRRDQYNETDFPLKYEGKLIKALRGGVPKMAVCPTGLRVVLMLRDPEEIRQSYNAFFSGNMPVSNNEEIVKEMNLLEEKIRNRKDVLSLDVLWYRDVVANPLGAFTLLRDHGWSIDVEKCVAVVDEGLVRYKHENLHYGVL